MIKSTLINFFSIYLINNFSTKESLEKGTEMSSKIIQKIGARLN